MIAQQTIDVRLVLLIHRVLHLMDQVLAINLQGDGEQSFAQTVHPIKISPPPIISTIATEIISQDQFWQTMIHEQHVTDFRGILVLPVTLSQQQRYAPTRLEHQVARRSGTDAHYGRSARGERRIVF